MQIGHGSAVWATGMGMVTFFLTVMMEREWGRQVWLLGAALRCGRWLYALHSGVRCRRLIEFSDFGIGCNRCRMLVVDIGCWVGEG